MQHVERIEGIVHNPNQLEIPAIAELAKRTQWVCWTLEVIDGKPRKIPYQPCGRKAASTKPATWSTFQECFEAAFTCCKFNGIGFVFTKKDDYVGIDLDDCVNADGLLTDFATEIVERVDSYTEFSPSGTGIHIICKGSLPDSLKTKHIEMYSQGRYFCVTGAQLGDNARPIRFAGEQLGELYGAHKKNQARGNGHADVNLPGDVAMLGAKFPWKKHRILHESDKAYRTAWEAQRSGDLSSDVMSCLVLTAQLGWPDDELAALYVMFYQQQGRGDKLERASWQGFVLDQVERAKEYAKSNKPIELAELDDQADEEGALVTVSAELGANLTKVTQVGSVLSQWYLTIDEVDFCVGTTSQLFKLDHVKAKIFEVTGVAIPGMKKVKWEHIVGLLGREAIKVEADESIEFGLMNAAYEQYIEQYKPEKTNYTTVDRNRPIEHRDGAIGINQIHFAQFLNMIGVRLGLSPAGWLRAMGFVSKLVNAKDGDRQRSRRYWLGPNSPLGENFLESKTEN